MVVGTGSCHHRGGWPPLAVPTTPIVDAAAPKVAAVLAAADAVDTAVDASQDLSDADLGALKVAVTLAFQDA